MAGMVSRIMGWRGWCQGYMNGKEGGNYTGIEGKQAKGTNNCNKPTTSFVMIKKIVHRMVNTRWTPSGEWMSDTILCIFY